MPEFVKQDTNEEQDDEEKAGKHRGLPAIGVVDVSEPSEEQDEGDVDTDVDAHDPRQMK